MQEAGYKSTYTDSICNVWKQENLSVALEVMLVANFGEERWWEGYAK